MHINADPEKYRDRFVTHKDKPNITIIRDEFVKGKQSNDWPGVFSSFEKEIVSHIGEENHQLLVADFSTTTPIDRSVSSLVLMDAVQSFFSFRVKTRCGIPEFHIRGTVEDWRLIKERIQKFTGLGLEKWIAQLSDILDQFISVKEGSAVDLSFWRSFYKDHSVSGGHRVTGWILALFPYLQDLRGNLTFNPYCEDYSKACQSFPFVHPNQFPAGISKVPFIWEYLGVEYPYDFLGGFFGTYQSTDNVLTPAIGWAVAPTNSSTKNRRR